jgi:crotonobetainyl-CoA:carnitine CoA-transferase CaiB-like acyl-CoA transferase
MSSEFLKDIHVLDLSQFLPGPYATQMLADMGADVLKIEPPRGDPMRELNPVTNERGPAPFHAAVNAGKRVVTIDLKSDEGRDGFSRLARSADVLLASYRPGVLERLGFGPDHLRELNPRLIHCALSGFGQTGPLRLRAGHDINYVAMTGSLSASGTGEKPVMAFPPIADYGGALQAVAAITGALLGRERSGEGAYLDVAMADAVLAWQAYGLTQAATASAGSGRVPVRGGDLLNGGAACYQIYATSGGGFISLGAIEEVFWRNFCRALGREDWVGRQLEPMPQTELISQVTEVIAANSRDHWDGLLGDVDCCYHPVLDYSEVPAWPQVIERRLVDEGSGIRFPVWTDGQPPPGRAPMEEVSLDDAIAAWSEPGGSS